MTSSRDSLDETQRNEIRLSSERQSDPPSSDTVSADEDPEPVDLNHFRMVTDYDHEFMIELAGRFIEDGSRMMDEIQAAIDGQNMENAQNVAHTLKGVSASLGANQLTVIVDAIEKGASQDRYDAIKQEFTRLKTEWNCVEKFLRELLEQSA